MIAQIFPCQLVVHFHQKLPARKTSSVICGQQGFYIRLKQAVYPILLIQIRFIDHLFIGKQFFSPLKERFIDNIDFSRFHSGFLRFPIFTVVFHITFQIFRKSVY